MPQNSAASEKLQEPIVIRVNKASMLLGVITSLAVCLLGAWLLSIGRDHMSRADSAGWLALVFGGLCLLVSLFYLFAPQPLLTIDAQGMLHRPFFRRPRTIKWKEIVL